MINIYKLTKFYNNKCIFENKNIKINKGELIAITGKSGCGKTTLLNIIGLIDLNYSGTVEIDSVVVNQLKNKKKQEFIRTRINYLFQNYALIDDQTVEENLMHALFYSNLNKNDKLKAIRESLSLVGLESIEKSKIYSLSGGEQQRVAIARTILKPGDILLADEPTGNLDYENRNVIMQCLLMQHKMGKTVIIVTHDSKIASQCERIIEL